MDRGLHDRIDDAIEDGTDVGAIVAMLPDSTLALVADACRDYRKTLASMSSRFLAHGHLADPGEELRMAIRVVELAMRDRALAARAAKRAGQRVGLENAAARDEQAGPR